MMIVNFVERIFVLLTFWQPHWTSTWVLKKLQFMNVDRWCEKIFKRKFQLDAHRTLHQILDQWWNLKLLFQIDSRKKWIILVPIHLPDHWTLVVIHVKNKTIKYYDSLKGRGNEVLLTIEQYMFKEHSARKKPLRGKYKRETASDNPTQSASSLDCGLFVSVYAEHVSRNAPLAFDEIDMKYYR